MVVWGDFESMSVHYLKELAKRGPETPMLFSKELEKVWGVCTYSEFAQMQKLSGIGMYRPVCAASPDELMGLLLARFMDFNVEESDGDDKKDLSAGEQSGGRHPVVDAGGDRSKEGGRSEDAGRSEEEDHDRTIH